jgi:hypothetical protein
MQCGSGNQFGDLKPAQSGRAGRLDLLLLEVNTRAPGAIETGFFGAIA